MISVPGDLVMNPARSPLVQIITGDCRDVLSALPPASFDSCVTDPPYGETDLSWDQAVRGWVPAVARVLKPAASIWVFGSMRYLHRVFLEMAEHGFTYSQDIVWEKHNGSSMHADRFRRVHEHAVLFYRGDWADVFHQVQVTNDATARTIRRKRKPHHWDGIGEGNYSSVEGGPRLARSVIYSPSEHGRAIHPTQKPVEVLLPLVRYSTPPGGSVVDCFSGSGSLGIAARIAGLSAVLIEKDMEMAAKSRARLDADAPLLTGAA